MERVGAKRRREEVEVHAVGLVAVPADLIRKLVVDHLPLWLVPILRLVCRRFNSALRPLVLWERVPRDRPERIWRRLCKDERGCFSVELVCWLAERGPPLRTVIKYRKAGTDREMKGLDFVRRRLARENLFEACKAFASPSSLLHGFDSRFNVLKWFALHRNEDALQWFGALCGAYPPKEPLSAVRLLMKGGESLALSPVREAIRAVWAAGCDMNRIECKWMRWTAGMGVTPVARAVAFRALAVDSAAKHQKLLLVGSLGGGSRVWLYGSAAYWLARHSGALPPPPSRAEWLERLTPHSPGYDFAAECHERDDPDTFEVLLRAPFGIDIEEIAPVLLSMPMLTERLLRAAVKHRGLRMTIDGDMAYAHAGFPPIELLKNKPYRMLAYPCWVRRVMEELGALRRAEFVKRPDGSYLIEYVVRGE
jgi:hypothetical protein